MKVGLIGTGLMGAPMAVKLAEAGYQVTAYNRTTEKLKPLAEIGIHTTNKPLEVIQASDCIILMLTDATAIENTILSSETRDSLAGKTIIQMGTIAREQVSFDRTIELKN